MCDKTVAHLRALMLCEQHKPVFGICLGHQLMSLAAGASTFKMRWVCISYVFCMYMVMFCAHAYRNVSYHASTYHIAFVRSVHTAGVCKATASFF